MIKLCKSGTGKASGFEGCYERKQRYKFGLCAGCFQKWINSTAAGQTYLRSQQINSIKQLRKVSKKRISDGKKYAELRKQFLKENPKCAVTGKQATQVHHMAGRIGDLFLDKTFWLPVCHEAHMRIELNPLWAKEQGYSVSRLANDKS